MGLWLWQWVALLTLSALALYLKAQERWIGWSPRQRERWLGLVINNSRFLVLPLRQPYPNLASRVLGLVLRRLSAGWQASWGGIRYWSSRALWMSRSIAATATGPAVSKRPAPRRALVVRAGILIRRMASPSSFICANRARAPARPPATTADALPSRLAAGETDLASPCPFRAPALENLLARLSALPDSRSGHGLRHRQRFELATAADCTPMGACGNRAFENASRKFKQRQFRALGCQPGEQDGRHYPPSD